MRLGLCCIFLEEPIKFPTTTATSVAKMSKHDAMHKLSRLALHNAESLLLALKFCYEKGIGCFRINSHVLPLKTHPTLGYDISELPQYQNIIDIFKKCGDFAKNNNIRTCFHPDQFVVLNSKKDEVVNASLKEIEYQAEVAEWVNADVINIHGGGAYGDKKQALRDLIFNLGRLSSRARKRVTVENDDKIYTPADLLPVCHDAGIPLVYDVHHHRCNPDNLTIEEATELAIETWNREPIFHISSPLEGWSGPKPLRHHDFINLDDFPDCWRNQFITVEVEAKAKENAVIKLKEQLYI